MGPDWASLFRPKIYWISPIVQTNSSPSTFLSFLRKSPLALPSWLTPWPESDSPLTTPKSLRPELLPTLIWSPMMNAPWPPTHGPLRAITEALSTMISAMPTPPTLSPPPTSLPLRITGHFFFFFLHCGNVCSFRFVAEIPYWKEMRGEKRRRRRNLRFSCALLCFGFRRRRKNELQLKKFIRLVIDWGDFIVSEENDG